MHTGVFMSEAQVTNLSQTEEMEPGGVTPMTMTNDVWPLNTQKLEKYEPLNVELEPNADELCRLCGTRQKFLIPIFGTEGQTRDIVMKIWTHMRIQISEDGCLPMGICRPCIENVDATAAFINSCTRVNARLCSMFIVPQDLPQPDTGGSSEATDSGSSCGKRVRVERSQLIQCTLCPMTWADSDALQDHYTKTHHKVPCADCNSLFDCADELSAHQVKTHLVPATRRSKRLQNNAATIARQVKHSDITNQENSCTVCNLQCPDPDYLEVHYKTDHKWEYCRLCCSGFETSEVLRQHQRLEHKVTEDEKHEETTRKRGPTRRTYRKQKGPFKCDVCGKEFRCHPSRFKLHVMRHSNVKNEVCHVCQKKFNNRQALLTHQKTHNQTKSFTCDLCKHVFKLKRYLVVHFQKVHMKCWYYKCKFCDVRYDHESVMKKHVTEHQMIPWTFEEKYYLRMSDFQCEVCGKYSANQLHLQAHLQDHKRMSTDGSGKRVKGQKNFQCEVCAKLFSDKTQLMVHLKIHTGEKPLQCQYCPARFRHQQSLTHHEMLHEGNLPFKCEQCPKAYNSRTTLKYHVRKAHLNIRPFVCEFCNKAFLTKHSLNVHRRIHTGVRPYKCQYCYREFTQKHEMLRHELTHTQSEYLYKCSKCNFGSNRRKYVYEHEAQCFGKQL